MKNHQKDLKTQVEITKAKQNIRRLVEWAVILTLLYLATAVIAISRLQ